MYKINVKEIRIIKKTIKKNRKKNIFYKLYKSNDIHSNINLIFKDSW